MGESFDAGMQSRYDLSLRTYRQLQRDHIRFMEKYAEEFENGFISQILVNYMCYAQEKFLYSFENGVMNALNDKRHDEYIKDYRLNNLTEKLSDKISEFDFSTNASFKKRIMITYILEQFADLPLSEREMVYCYDHYKAIKEAIKKSEILIVSSSNNEYEVKPVDLKVDENVLSYYLIGYSRLKGSEKDFESHSYKLSRISKCWSKHKPFELSSKERRTLAEINEKFGSAYIAKNLEKKDIEKSVVRLTLKGYDLYLKTISHQRPIPIIDPKPISINSKEYYELTFDCSHWQIKNYFFSFGAEAEIISPLWLRKDFLKKYEASVEAYNGVNVEKNE